MSSPANDTQDNRPPRPASPKTYLVWTLRNPQRRPRQHQDRHDNAVKAQHLGENQDQDHADVQPGLLGARSHYKRPGVGQLCPALLLPLN